MDIAGKARKLEQRISRTVDAAVGEFIAQSGTSPIEILHAVLDGAEAEIQDIGRGRRVFPFNRVRVHVIAAADGTVEKLFNSVRGGTTVYVRSADQHWIYYYAHLSAYAPGLHEGQQVRRGEVIARVGHTGDASAAGPHLHFAINQMAPGEHWWNGTPINPYPLLAGKKANG